jgi:hypothetical protein
MDNNIMITLIQATNLLHLQHITFLEKITDNLTKCNEKYKNEIENKNPDIQTICLCCHQETITKLNEEIDEQLEIIYDITIQLDELNERIKKQNEIIVNILENN